MFPEGIPDTFKLAELIGQIREKKFPTVQHMATAYGQGDRWAARVFKAAKERNLLPHDMTPRQWLDLFPVTRRLSKEDLADQKRRRALIREAELEEHRREREARKVAEARIREAELEARRLARAARVSLPPTQTDSMITWSDEDGMHWEPPRRFADLSLDFLLSTYRFDDLTTVEKKRVVKEKLADRQKGVCMICRKPFSTDRVPCLDHDHETGKIRGLLCTFCNMALGGFQDSIMSLENAIKYLLEHATIQLHGNA